MVAGSYLMISGGLGILIVLLFYPLFVLLAARREDPVLPKDPLVLPNVAVITAARNAASLLEAKLENFHRLDYPAENLSLLVASDASTDETRAIVEAAADPRIQLVEQTERRGKAAALNMAVEQTDAGFLLFSDVDALLAPDAVRRLIRHFTDERVGGVCGRRLTAQKGSGLSGAQQTYINLDSALKRAESARGRISSNDGKIHMIRRFLFRPIPPDVTDDLYTGLSVTAQGYHFLFDPEAVAEVRVPSRDARHEISRRRRIVTRSLTAVFRMRRVLNPLRFGWFSVGLLINKVGRRLLPFFVLLLAAGLVRMVLSLSEEWILLAGAVAGAAYGLVAWGLRSRLLLRPVHLVRYILAGFVGSAWGVIDFLAGRRVHIWEPKKTEEVAA